MALSRRSALGRLILGAVGFATGTAKADPPWEKPTLAALRCCGTCKFFGQAAAKIEGISDDGTVLTVPLFGWCSKAGKMPKKPLPDGLLVIGSDIPTTFNRHFLQVCKAHKFNKNAKHTEKTHS